MVDQIKTFRVKIDELAQLTKLELFINNSYTHLSEARFWLGFEMQRIKEQSDKQ